MHTGRALFLSDAEAILHTERHCQTALPWSAHQAVEIYTAGVWLPGKTRMMFQSRSEKLH